MKEKGRLFVVLGMHRSGTSTVTRALKILGVSAGESLIPVGPDNPKGFFEDAEINALNIRMMSLVSQEWDSLAPFTDDHVTLLKNAGFVEQAQTLLSARLEAHPMYVLKDPRIAKLMPFWADVFASMVAPTFYVLTIRNPRSVKDSLRERNHLIGQKSYLMWLEYVISSLEYTAGSSRMLINFDDLVADPEQVLRRASLETGLPIDEAELTIFKKDFLEDDLRHTLYTVDDVTNDEESSPLVVEIYERLLAAASNATPLEDSWCATGIKDWHSALYDAGLSLTLVDRLERIARNAQAEADRSMHIVSTQANELASLNARLEMAADVELRNRELEVRIAELLESTSWRLTAPLRRMSDALKKRGYAS